MSTVRCNSCGYEFTPKGSNTLDTVNEALGALGQITSAFSGNIFAMDSADRAANNAKYRVKCPRCNSTNVTAVVESSKPAISINTNASVDALLKRAALFLEDGEWDTADVYYDRILDADPENYLAYIGKLMVELRCHNQEEVLNCKESLDDKANYKKALRFGSEEQKAVLLRCNEEIKARLERERLDAIYLAAEKKMQEAATEEAFEAVIAEFQKISGWKDADEKVEACQKRVEELKVRNEQKSKRNQLVAIIAVPVVLVIVVVVAVISNVVKYNNAVDLMAAGQYEEAAEVLSKLNNYKDSEEKLAEALAEIELIRMEESYQEVQSLLAEDSAEAHRTAYEKLLELGDYKDAKEILDDFQLLKSERKWSFDGGKTYTSETYRYSRNGYKMQDTFNGEDSDYSHTFNEQGQLLKKTGRNGYEMEYRYHQNGELSYSLYPYTIDSKSNRYEGFFETEYDTNGLPVSYKYLDEGVCETQWNWEYIYGEDGSMVSVVVRYQHDESEGTYTVDLQAQGLELVVDDTGYRPLQYRAVSEDGKKETNYSIYWKDGELVWAENWMKEYDDHHNEIYHAIYPTSEFSSDTITTYSYVYDEKGQVLSRTSHFGAVVEYVYDEFGNCIEKNTMNAEGDITEKEINRYDYFYTPNA